MPRALALLLALAAFCSACCWSLSSHRFEVLRPRLGIPAVRSAGQAVGIDMRLSSPLWTPAIRLHLIDEEGHRFELSKTTLRSGAARRLEALLPEDLPAGPYDLEFLVDGVRLVSPKAVHVLGEAKEEFKVVQLADLPIFGPGSDGDTRMQQIVTEINTIAPDLVLITGDIAYTGTWRHFEAALGHFAAFDAPVVAGIGNHEYKGLAAFFTLFGPLQHVVEFGDRRVITLNSGHGRDQLTESQYAWLRAAMADGARGDILIQLHHPLFWKRNLRVHRDDVVELCDEQEVPIVLSGHWHGDYVFDQSGRARSDTWDFEGTKYVVTTAAGADLRPEFSASPVHHGYRLIRMRGKRVLDYSYDWDGDGIRHASCSLPVGELRTVVEGPGSVSVYNDLNEDLEDALITVWLDGAGAIGATPRPSSGQLHDVKVIDGRRRVRIRHYLPAHSTIALTLGED